MQVEWYGQSAFRLTHGATTVVIDPFDDLGPLAARGLRWDYRAISGVDADLLLVTHEHLDHSGVGAIGGDPVILRSMAGRLDSPIGEVLAVASEHDEAAGTERGPNTLFAFTLGGRRVAHLGDLGQRILRDEQAQALGRVDLLFVPIGVVNSGTTPRASAGRRYQWVHWRPDPSARWASLWQSPSGRRKPALCRRSALACADPPWHLAHACPDAPGSGAIGPTSSGGCRPSRQSAAAPASARA
jgi:hypothetical protein